ncbi:UDP-N-acetylglucosamine 2-epimerase [Pontimonas sp.]|nr:UDP-N-acetylglucosamine 2-epimerase [Pontimonas sp.]
MTSTRADFGLLKGLLHRMNDSSMFDLQVVATGAHLLEQFGATRQDILNSGFTVNLEVTELTSATTGSDVADQVGGGIVGFSAGFQGLGPDVVVLLGDRYEMLAAAVAAFFLKIPIVHLHGGEVTQGAFDDAIRHSITKFAQIHCVAAKEYAERIIRAGEPPESVHVTGGLGVDEILRTDLLSKKELEDALGLNLGWPFFLVTYHPVTAGTHDSSQEIESLIEALDSFSGATVIFTMPGADPEHQVIVNRIAEAVSLRAPDWHFVASLGQQKYLSLVAVASAVVGNSSSGLLEAPTLKTPTVNIGNRQRGRRMASSVLQADATTARITEALRHAVSPQFAAVAAKTENPYGGGGAVDRIVKILEETDFSRLGQKIYHDELGQTKVEGHGEPRFG